MDSKPYTYNLEQAIELPRKAMSFEKDGFLLERGVHKKRVVWWGTSNWRAPLVRIFNPKNTGTAMKLSKKQ